MTTFTQTPALNPADDDRSLMGWSCPSAGLVCLFGFFLHLVLSEPLLNTIGFHYSGDEGKFYEKIHPGTYFTIISFLMLIWSRGNPIKQLFIITREYTVYSCLLYLTVALFIYMVLRSGPVGMAFMIDTHLTVPICAIVLCYTPLSYCKKAVHFFVFIGFLNSMIGIAESIGKFRIFAYDTDWGVLKEEQFRASSLQGHPLNNAMFTTLAIFVTLAMNYPRYLKVFLVSVFMVSLVSFGGRIGLIFSVFGFLVLGALNARQQFAKGVSMLQAILIIASTLMVPVLLLGSLYLLINSSIGERIATHSQWDESANSRGLAFFVFNYLSTEDIIFGVSTNRILDIAYRLNLTVPLSDIENPWLLMFMYLGVVCFPAWFLMTCAFLLRVMKNQNAALRIATLGYFAVASTSNSFGRKDANYMVTISVVICAVRALGLGTGLKPPPEDIKRLDHFNKGLSTPT